MFSNYKGRKFYIWGNGKRADLMSEMILKFTDIKVAGYIDSSVKKCCEGNSILSPDYLDKKNMYIIIPFAAVYQEVVDLLTEKGFVEKKDYVYPSYSLRKLVEGRKNASIF